MFFSYKYLLHLAKSPFADICSNHPLFSFAQNRGKFAPNCLSLQLFHLLYKVAHRGKQGAKKGEPFGSPFLSYFYSIFRIWQSHLWQIFAPNTSFFPSPKIGANSLQTALSCNCSTCSAKRHTRANGVQKKANPLARLSTLFSVL